jgi:HTH-type transcriptional repressor of NAD biosynthesis genes
MVALAQGTNCGSDARYPVLMSADRHYKLGLVVGKFAPLHLGHQWLIEEAARRCDRLLILSYSNPEFDRCSVTTRRRWLSVCVPGNEAIVFDDSWLRQRCLDRGIGFRPIPPNNAIDEVHQNFLGWLLEEVFLRSPDAFFCSEAYGPACAATLTRVLRSQVHAVVLDADRQRVPVSATQIRDYPHAHQQWMNADVAAAFVYRIALLGGESSGKTTLASALAMHFGTVWVPEYGRELWEQQRGNLSESDLLKIGQEQIRREEASLRVANTYLFCDTSPLTTAGYSLWMFGHVDPQLASLAARAYDAVVLCRPDFPFVQDGTRREELFRSQQHVWYQHQTKTMRCPVLEVTGSVRERVSSVAEWLSTLSLR